MITILITIFTLLLFCLQQGCSGSFLNRQSEKKTVKSPNTAQVDTVVSQPIIKVTPVNVYTFYPPAKKKDAEILVSAYDTDVKYRKLATIEVFSSFKADRKKIMQVLIDEAKKIGADGIVNIHYGTGKEIVSDFLRINKKLYLPIKQYKSMMLTSGLAIQFLD